MITKTVKELATDLNVDYITAQSLIKLLIAKGLATKDGERKSESGKGKASGVFTMPEQVTISLVSAA